MRDIILASVALIIIAVAAPKFLTSQIEQQPQTAAKKSTAQAALARTRRNTGGEVEISSAANGHFYLDAEIEGEDIAVMVDTGASIVALRQSDARRAGIRVHRDDFNLPLSTANGTTYAASVNLDSVAVDDIEIRNVQAVVIPDGQLPISLLGTSFLNKLRRFEVSGGKLILEN